MRPLAFAACLAPLLALAACNQKPAANPQQAAAAAQDAKAAKDLAAYRQLVQANSVELAASIGRDIVKRHPGTTAATEVQQTLPAMEAKAKEIGDAKRVAALWMYQSGAGSDGGAQHVASIYSTTPANEPERVRLLLRRHADWGQSVYLHGGANGFDCASPCKVSIKFDDKPETWAGEIPSGGENAMFVDDDQKFIDRLRQVHKVIFDVKREGMGPQTLVFETSGFDPNKWPQLGAK